MEPALDPAGGVTGFVVKPVVTPAGAPETDSVTGELKLLSEVTVTVAEPGEGAPCTTDKVGVESPTEKLPADSVKAHPCPGFTLKLPPEYPVPPA
jgi:hypothetical protein